MYNPYYNTYGGGSIYGGARRKYRSAKRNFSIIKIKCWNVIVF